MSAGARLTVIRLAGSARPEATSAARTRSRDSATALSARPTTLKTTAPLEICTCTSTGLASTPSKATVATRTTMTSAPLERNWNNERSLTGFRKRGKNNVGTNLLRPVASQRRHPGYRLSVSAAAKDSGRDWGVSFATERRGRDDSPSHSACLAAELSGAGSQRRFSPLELLPPVSLGLAGRDQGGVSRPRQHRLALRQSGQKPVLRDAAAVGRIAQGLRAAITPAGLHALQRVLARPLHLPILRRARRADLRPRHAALQGRRDDLGERGRRLLALQPAQGGPAALGSAYDADAEALRAVDLGSSPQRPAVPAQLSARKLDGLSLLGLGARALMERLLRRILAMGFGFVLAASCGALFLPLAALADQTVREAGFEAALRGLFAMLDETARDGDPAAGFEALRLVFWAILIAVCVAPLALAA